MSPSVVFALGVVAGIATGLACVGLYRFGRAVMCEIRRIQRVTNFVEFKTTWPNRWGKP